MAFLFREDPYPKKGRLTGFDRYRELLERDHTAFFLSALVTILGFAPFIAGATCAVASSSLLVMLAAAAAGGLIAGPFYYALYDIIFRSLRDAPIRWWREYRNALKKNWKSALLPGVALCLFLGVAAFMAAMLFYWAEVFAGWGTVIFFLVSLVFSTMLLSVYWPQLVLFEQSGGIRLRNCLLFCVKYFWRTLGVASLQVLWWAIFALFLPWSAFLAPLLGLWFIAFLANFLLYRPLNEAFEIEKQIQEKFPRQILDREED